jgi:hypothetical protein
MSLIGVDLNATRARAVSGPRPRGAVQLRLEDDHLDLPLAVSLEGRHPLVGRAGASLRRRLPHVACLDFLPHLGGARTWSAGRHRLDAGAALALLFGALRKPLGGLSGVALALPAYLGPDQVALLFRLAEQARWRLLGSAPVPLAVTLAAGAVGTPLPEAGLVLVVDVDGHALTFSAVELAPGQARLLSTYPMPHLGAGAWLLRLLDGVAHRCVRLSRRDPRESADAEQSLYDQLAHYLDAGAARPLLDLSLQAASWYQHLMFHPDELAAFVAPLVRQSAVELDAFRAALVAGGGPAEVSALLLTPAAGRLPGLLPGLEAQLQTVLVGHPDEGASGLDFGEGPLEGAAGGLAVCVLADDGVARAAHALAARIHQGDLPTGHLGALPLPGVGPAPAPEREPGLEAGPARLSFRGQEHLLSGPTFTLGRDPSCDLVFESELYPTVSARHCEVLFDRRAYMLCDRSRHGTLLNERPVKQQAALHAGDWIRLGPAGPVLRFLGQSASCRTVVPR